MTYEERKKWICQQCNQKIDCAYVNRKMEYKCLLVEEQMVGWELGYKDVVDKACEQIEKFVYNSVVTDNLGEPEKQAIIIAFKEYMEEQQ